MAESLDFLWVQDAPATRSSCMSCPNCGATGEKPPICLSKPGAHPAWLLLRCPACGAGFYEDQTVSDYADEGMSAESTTYFLQQGAALSIFADILAHIRKPPGATYVEIGCGFGFGLDVAHHAMGWTARGMDPADLSAVGRRMLGVDILPAYFDPTTVADSSCDVVMATEVLEHLPDPAGFLREIRRGLKPDGIAVLTTPDIAAVRPAIAKPVLSATLTVGLHLILQSAASLEFLLRRAGFTDVRVQSDGWKLTAFAASVPLALRENAQDRQAIAIRYLIDRAEARPEADDLYFGFAGRAFFEAVSAQDAASADRVWKTLGRKLQIRYNIDVDRIVAPPAAVEAIGQADIASAMPLNLASIMLARAYQRLQLGEARTALLPRFSAINAVCAPLWAWLDARQIGDMQTRQILWVAQAEVALCVAAQGKGSALGMMSALAESPTGSGRDAVVRRGVEFLIHGERPHLAVRLARRESLPHMRNAGDTSTSALVRSFGREMFYRLRQTLRG